MISLFFKRTFLWLACCISFALTHECRAQGVLMLSPVQKVGPIWGLGFSSDSSLLAAGGGERNGQGTLQVWETHDWSHTWKINENRAVTCVAFSSDQTYLAAGLQNGEVILVELAAKKVVRRWPTGNWAVFGMAWTPDGKQIVACCASGAVKLWNAVDGTHIRSFDIWKEHGTFNPKLKGNEDCNMWDAAVSPDGKTLLTGGWNDTTRLWNLQTGEMLQNFFATESSTQGVEFTKDGRFFATSGIYGLAVVRDAKSLQIRTRLNASGRDIAVHPNGNWFVVGASDGIHVFKLPPTDVGTSAVGQNEVQKADVTIPEGRGEIRQVTYSSNGRFLASSAASGVVSIWDGENFKPLKTLEMK